MSSFVEGLAAGYGIAIPVGAVAILIVSLSMRSGFKAGFMAGAGAATADVLYASIATAAGAAAAAALQPVSSPLRTLSGLILIGMAASGLWQGLARSSRSTGETSTPGNPLKTYAQFLGITLVNPLTVVYFTALVLGSTVSGNRSLVTSSLFVVGAGLASLSWQTLLASIGGIAGHRLSTRFQLLAVILGNIVVLALGCKILIAAG